MGRRGNAPKAANRKRGERSRARPSDERDRAANHERRDRTKVPRRAPTPSDAVSKASPRISPSAPFDGFAVWTQPTWRTERPDAEGFWESRSRSACAGVVERFVVYVSAGELRFGEGEGERVAQLGELADREWRGPIVP